MYERSQNKVLGFFIFLGLVALSFGIYHSTKFYKLSERVVTVKGLAQKQVTANLAIWSISFFRNSNSLLESRNKIEKDSQVVKSFLLENKFTEAEIFISAPKLKDRFSNDYGNTRNIRYRYNSTLSVTIKTSQIQKVINIKNHLGELQKKGVFIDYNNYENKTLFSFTKLNEIKPEMIKQATISARKSAQQFAKDSQSSLGKIKYANQGVFSINNVDSTTPHIKKVRVVTTVTYYLEN